MPAMLPVKDITYCFTLQFRTVAYILLPTAHTDKFFSITPFSVIQQSCMIHGFNQPCHQKKLYIQPSTLSRLQVSSEVSSDQVNDTLQCLPSFTSFPLITQVWYHLTPSQERHVFWETTFTQLFFYCILFKLFYFIIIVNLWLIYKSKLP